jgi:hypothetical protein
VRSPTRKSVAFVLAFAFSMLALRADVTIRYKNDYKLASFLPPELVNQALQQVGSFPGGAVFHIKGNKGYTNYGKITYLTDFGNQEITLLDASGKTFATMPMKDFVNKLGAAMAAQTLTGSIKTNFSTRKTGRTDIIQGVAAEENEMIISMDQADPIEPPAATPLIKIETQAWTAKPEEALRVPALRQWAGYAAFSNYLMNPLIALQKVFARIPGSTQGFTSMIEENSKSFLLKAHTEVPPPIMGVIAQQTRTQLPAGFDPNAPLMEITTEIVEISADPVDDSVFQLPEGYQAAPAEELMKSILSSFHSASANARRASSSANPSRRQGAGRQPYPQSRTDLSNPR